ncbi:MAG: hypothetical protein QXO93_00205 [Acidilobaceae archaeon]
MPLVYKSSLSSIAIVKSTRVKVELRSEAQPIIFSIARILLGI